MNTSGAVAEGNSDDAVSSFRVSYDRRDDYNGGGLCEIEEEFVADEKVESIREGVAGTVFLGDDSNGGEDAVYVAVGKQGEETSYDALLWTLNNSSISPSTVVFLIHVFPEIKHIPTPLGKLPINQANPEQKENFMAQERNKRRQFLEKFLSICSVYQVKVDTILIESDSEAKAILELIPILSIRKLVVGTTKSNLRRMRSKKGNGVSEQILQNAPEFCEVKVICEGKEMSELPLVTSPSPSATPTPIHETQTVSLPSNISFVCGCFKSNGS